MVLLNIFGLLKITMKYKFFILLLILLSTNVFAKSIKLIGLSKLSNSDIEAIIGNSLNYDYNQFEFNDVVNKLYKSDVIYDVKTQEASLNYIIEITESSLINEIYFNGNVYIKNESFYETISSKKKSFFLKDKINQDVSIIKQLYKNIGFASVSINVSTEKYSNDKVNLIFDINEGPRNKITSIKFIGNKNFSYKYLNSLILSKSISNLNIFTQGSNFNESIFESDRMKLINFYKQKGFFDIDVTYLIEKNLLSDYSLNFYIDENLRSKIGNINFSEINTINQNELANYVTNYKKKIIKNKNYYDQNIINEFVDILNEHLIANNIANYEIKADISINNEGLVDILIYENNFQATLVDQINIYGNSITKDNTIRSKILLSPGDQFFPNTASKIENKLSKLPYLNKSSVLSTTDNNLTTIDIDVNENKKTGNLLIAGSVDNDVGLGVAFGISDINFLGTGNTLKSNFSLNNESANIDFSYKQFAYNNPNISNQYNLFNKEKDLISSFGYKSSNTGAGYNLVFQYSDKIDIGVGVTYENIKGHSPIAGAGVSITDSINTFNNFIFNLDLSYDTTNNIFYPTSGIVNKLNIQYSPNKLSGDKFYKAEITNNNYFELKNNDSFIFLLNNLGYADGINSNLKTINTFSLGGLNFKGFDYRGVGPVDSNNIYLGGNKFLTSTIGYGSSFIFDSKDNVNLKLFYTTGSLWDSDYSSDNKFKLRSSTGVSLDFLTAVGPISFSYSVPVEKEANDKDRRFSFSLGTAF